MALESGQPAQPSHLEAAAGAVKSEATSLAAKFFADSHPAPPTTPKAAATGNPVGDATKTPTDPAATAAAGIVKDIQALKTSTDPNRDEATLAAAWNSVYTNSKAQGGNTFLDKVGHDVMKDLPGATYDAANGYIEITPSAAGDVLGSYGPNWLKAMEGDSVGQIVLSSDGDVSTWDLRHDQPLGPLASSTWYPAYLSAPSSQDTDSGV